MVRTSISAVAVLLLLAGGVQAQQKGTIKAVDADKNTITLSVDGKEMTFKVTPETMMQDAAQKPLEQRLQAPQLKSGAPVMFLAEGKEEGSPLRGLRLLGAQVGRPEEKKGEIRHGRVKKIDLDGMTITLTEQGKDHEFGLAEKTMVGGAKGDTLRERMSLIKQGQDVDFGILRGEGKQVLWGIRLAGAPAGPGGPPPLVKFDSSKLRPLTELGTDTYQGHTGGLYGNGKNERPAAHEAAGLALAKQVQPLDSKGQPSPSGKIVLMSVGMSNTSQMSQGFQKNFQADAEHNPAVVFVNGAVGGMTASIIQNPDVGKGADYWAQVDQRLQSAGLSRAQVQVIWIKEADGGPREGFPGYAKKLQGELAKIVQLLPARFPNLKQVYLSSRTYGGYATTPLNPEPYAYESGLAVRWLIEDQLKGDPALNYDASKGAVRAPWLSWGPYVWANGTSKRADGFSYTREDFSPKDGTHLTEAGMDKVGRLMLQFFKGDATTRPWFVAR